MAAARPAGRAAHRAAPLLGEPRPFSSSSSSASIRRARERPAAEMVDEQVVGHRQLEPGPRARSARSSSSKNPSPNRSSSPPTASYTARFISRQKPESLPAVNHCPGGDEELGEWPPAEECFRQLPPWLQEAWKHKPSFEAENWMDNLHEREWVWWSGAAFDHLLKIVPLLRGPSHLDMDYRIRRRKSRGTSRL